VPLLYLLGVLKVPTVVAVAALLGLVSVVGDAGRQSVLPRLVHADLLTVANARMEQAGAVGRTSGPLLAGVLVRVLGAPVSLLVDAVTFVASGVLIGTIRRVESTNAEPAPDRHLRRELAEGLRWVYRHALLAPMAIWVHVWFLFNAMLSTVFVPYALRDLDLGALGLGVAYGISGAGAVLGGAVAGRVARRLGLGWAVIAAHWLTPLAFGLVVVTPPGPVAWVLVGLAQLLFGLFVGLSSPLELSFRQTVTPDRLQGRMNATIRSLNWGMIAIGAPVGGLLADQLGARPALLVGIAGVALASAGLMLSPFRRAR
jgi:predicted MFS family arabinose efflux permease